MREAEAIQLLQRHLLRNPLNPTGPTYVIQELGIQTGRVRVDMAAVTDDLYGFEIKTAGDSLTRLKRQVSSYSKVLDFASAVVAPNHVKGTLKRVPDWWGLYILTDGGVALERQPLRNPQIDVGALVQLLWRDEAKAFLKERGALRGLANRSRRLMWTRIKQQFDEDEVRKAVRYALVHGPKRGGNREVLLPPLTADKQSDTTI